MRAFRPLPIRRADEDFGIVFALGAMKFVNRHGAKIIGAAKISRREFFAMRQMVAVPAAQGGIADVGKKKVQRR